MISNMRRNELVMIANNEIRYRGFNWNVPYIKKTYAIYDLTDEEAQAVSYLIHNADIQLPAFPTWFDTQAKGR